MMLLWRCPDAEEVRFTTHDCREPSLFVLLFTYEMKIVFLKQLMCLPDSDNQYWLMLLNTTQNKICKGNTSSDHICGRQYCIFEANVFGSPLSPMLCLSLVLSPRAVLPAVFYHHSFPHPYRLYGVLRIKDILVSIDTYKLLRWKRPSFTLVSQTFC